MSRSRSTLDGAFYDHHLAKQPALGVWQHVELHVIVGGVASHVTMKLGADQVVDDDLRAPSVQPAPVVLVLGITTTAWSSISDETT